MLTKIKRFEYQKIIILISVFVLLRLSSGLFAKTPTEKILQWKTDDFRMYLTPVLKENLLEKITAEENKGLLVELGNWPHTPLEVDSPIGSGHIRIRFEEDFVVIWYHSPVSLLQDKSTPLNAIRDTINEIVGETFVIGDDDTLIVQGDDSSVNPKTELVMASWPKEIPETKAIICRYGPVSSGKRDWKCLVSSVSILLKDKNVIIVMEKTKARHPNTFIYEGLIAGKVRLTKQETEKAQNKPILARNVIFGEEIDTKGISDTLLNGCMWPVANKMVGIKDVGPVSKLRPKPKKSVGEKEPDSEQI